MILFAAGPATFRCGSRSESATNEEVVRRDALIAQSLQPGRQLAAGANRYTWWKNLSAHQSGLQLLVIAPGLT